MRFRVILIYVAKLLYHKRKKDAREKNKLLHRSVYETVSAAVLPEKVRFRF